MESSSCMPSAHQRCRYVSWCIDSAESKTPVPSIMRATETSPEEFLTNDQPAGPRSVRLFHLSPQENSGNGTKATKPTFTKRTVQLEFTQSHRSRIHPQSNFALECIDRGPMHDEGKDEQNVMVRPPEVHRNGKQDRSLIHSENGSFLLPRSSPVISRHHQPLSGHELSTRASAPSGVDLLECKENSPQKQSKKPSCISVSANLCHLFSTGLSFPVSRQRGLAEVHQRQSIIDYALFPLSGLLSSTQCSKGKRCSGVQEFSACTKKTMEKENAHFIAVDMVLEVLECVKWACVMDSQHKTSADMPLHDHTHICKEDTYTHRSTVVEHQVQFRHSEENMNISHGKRNSIDVCTNQLRKDKEERKTEHQPEMSSVLSADNGYKDLVCCAPDCSSGEVRAMVRSKELSDALRKKIVAANESDCEVSSTLRVRNSLISVDQLAEQLMLEIRRRWHPSMELGSG